MKGWGKQWSSVELNLWNFSNWNQQMAVKIKNSQYTALVLGMVASVAPSSYLFLINLHRWQ